MSTFSWWLATGVVALGLLAVVPAKAAETTCEDDAPTSHRAVICADPALREESARLSDKLKVQLAGLSPEAAAVVRADHDQWRSFVGAACPSEVSPQQKICLERLHRLRGRHVFDFDARTSAGKFYYHALYVMVQLVGRNDDERRQVEQVVAVERVDGTDPAVLRMNETIERLALAGAARTASDGSPEMVVEMSLVDGFDTGDDIVHQFALSTRARALPFADDWDRSTENIFWLQKQGRMVTAPDLFRGGTKWVAAIRGELRRQAARNGLERPFAAIPKAEVDRLASNIAAWSFGVDGIAVHVPAERLDQGDGEGTTLFVPWPTVERFLSPFGRSLLAWGGD